MDSRELKKLFLEFFKNKGHVIIPSAPLIPEHDPTVLFTTAGMHPLVPYLMGQPHPKGKRLTSVQKCIRTGDIDDVGDDTHLTFFEMLGNWSLGDYFKKESLTWSYEFLTKVLGINKDKISVTVFAGDKDVPRDEEAANIWMSLGIPRDRIYFLSKEDNWWGPAGETGPCGPDSEIFIDTGKPKCSADCRPGCGCGKFVEVWNNVFMQYNKTRDGRFIPLKQRNIDTGMGVERTIAIINGVNSVYDTPILRELFKVINKPTTNREARIIVDHIRASVFILGDERGVIPSKTDQGYVLRRLIRRAVRYCKLSGINVELINSLALKVIDLYGSDYPSLISKKDFVINELSNEVKRFLRTLDKGLTHFNNIVRGKSVISGSDAFLLYQSFGFPIEMTVELAREKGLSVDVDGFRNEFIKHQQLSKKGAEKRFKGGLADNTIETTRLHTATHLLAEALRRVLDSNIKQKGSNITPERLRFDFNFPRKLTKEELKRVEDLVNAQIKKGLPVIKKEMTFKQAKSIGAQAEFEQKYGDKVFVYFIDDFSKEVCGGPHVSNTRELGHFRIIKEKGIGAGIRRIKAILE